MKNYRRKSHKETSIDLPARRRWKRIVEDEIAVKDNDLPLEINEMAYSLDKYIDKIESFRFEIAENWCLCKWYQLFDPSNKDFNHWKKELISYIRRLKLINLKNHASKKDHLHSILVDDYDFDDESMVFDIIHDKFKKEKIVDIFQIQAVSKEFTNNVDKLIDVIADRSLSLDDYIKETFG